jgi:branched-chain amino acid transport system substrate-binding protein
MQPVRAQPSPPYELNVILPLTGPGAFIGQTHQKTLQLLESVVNKSGGIRGQSLHFVFYDDQTSPQVSVQLANSLIAKHVPIVMGSSLSAMCKAMAPLFQTGPVQFCLSPAIYPAKDSYVFATSVSTKELLVALARYWRGRGWKKIALLATTDASGQDGEAALKDALAAPENKDLTLVDVEHFNPTDISATAQLSKIKASNADTALFWVPGTPFGTVLHGISDVGLEIPISSPSANMIYSQMKQYGDDVPKVLDFTGLGYTASAASNAESLAQLRQFDAVLDQANIHRDLQSGLTWDTGLIIVSALRRLGTNATADQLRQYILGLRSFAGITGIYNFSSGDQHGVGVDAAVIMRWDKTRGAWFPVSKFGGAPL